MLGEWKSPSWILCLVSPVTPTVFISVKCCKTVSHFMPLSHLSQQQTGNCSPSSRHSLLNTVTRHASTGQALDVGCFMVYIYLFSRKQGMHTNMSWSIWRGRGQPWELVLFYHVGSGYQTQVLRLCAKSLHLLNHLTNIHLSLEQGRPQPLSLVFRFVTHAFDASLTFLVLFTPVSWIKASEFI